MQNKEQNPKKKKKNKTKQKRKKKKIYHLQQCISFWILSLEALEAAYLSAEKENLKQYIQIGQSNKIQKKTRQPLF